MRIFTEGQHFRKALQNVAGRLDVGDHGMATIIESQTETHLHDQQILIVVPQDSIPTTDVVQVIALERIRNPRHIDIVEINQVHAIGRISLRFVPSISECCGQNPAMKFRTILQVVTERQLRRCRTTPLKRT